jgi:hypothetical protein
MLERVSYLGEPVLCACLYIINEHGNLSWPAGLIAWIAGIYLAIAGREDDVIKG